MDSICCSTSCNHAYRKNGIHQLATSSNYPFTVAVLELSHLCHIPYRCPLARIPIANKKIFISSFQYPGIHSYVRNMPYMPYMLKIVRRQATLGIYLFLGEAFAMNSIRGQFELNRNVASWHDYSCDPKKSLTIRFLRFRRLH